MRRANAAGAKQAAKDAKGDRRGTGGSDKCAFPGCGKRAKSHGVCNNPMHLAWTVAD
jgi:hypothetical protein